MPLTSSFVAAPELEPSLNTGPAAGQLTGEDVAGRVVSGGLQRIAGFVALNLLTAAAAVLLLRYLGVTNFGRYGTVMALMGIVQGVSDGGLTLTGARELSLRTSGHDRNELLGNLLGLRMLLTGTGVIVAVAFAAGVGYSQAMIAGTALVGVSVFLLSVQSALLLPLIVELKNSRLAVNDVLRQAVLVGGFVALTVAGASLVAFFAASSVAAVIVLLGTPALVGSRRLVRPRWSAPALRSLLIKTLPLALFGVLSVLYFRVLVVLMSVLQSSATELGYYVTSARVIETFLGIPVVLVGVVLPVLSVSARDDPGRLRYVTLRLTQVMTWLGAFLAIVLGTGARPILLLFGGSQYLGAVPVLQIQCVALVTIFITAAWTTPLVGMGRTRDLAASTLVGLTGVMVAGSVLITADGAIGAAIAAVLADVVYCAIVFFYARRSGAVTALRVGPFVRIALCGMPGLVIALVEPLPAAVGCVAATVVFLGLTYPLRALPPEILERMSALLQRARRSPAALP